MNKKYLVNTIGKQVRLVPAAYYVTVDGTNQEDDEWTFVSYENRVVCLRNGRTNSTCFLGDDSVFNYRMDPARGEQYGHLMLLAQLIVEGETVRHIPLTRPDERVMPTPRSLLGEAYLEISLDCHSWKNAFLNIHGWDIPESPLGLGDILAGDRLDVWDALVAHCVPDYSEENYSKYQHLFLAPLVLVRTRFDRALNIFQRVLPDDFQAGLVRAARELGTEFSGYVQMPSILRAIPGFDINPVFRGRFVSVIEVLKKISREADRLRAELVRPVDQG